MQEFHIGNTAQTGLLVMTNQSEVKAALDSRPPAGDEQYIQVENAVTVAGATARHGLILQFNVGFLSGNSQRMTDDDLTESYLRANVGYTRATNSLLVASPLDMAGLPGVFQILAVLLTGITTIYRPSTYYQLDIFDHQVDAREISDADWHAATTGNVLGALPPPLALVQVRARRHRNEIAQQHARVRGSKMPVDQLDNIKMSRLRLTLVDGHRVNPTVWILESKRCQQHPAWPGGNYQHELVWAYTEDGTARPTWILLPHPTLPNQYILCNNHTSRQYGPQQGEQFTLLMPLPKIFFYEAHRRHPDKALTAPALYSSLPSLMITTNSIYLNFLNGYLMLPRARLANPPQQNKETPCLQQRPLHQLKWKRSRKTSDKTGILHLRVSSRNTKLIRSMRILRSTLAYFRLSPVTGHL